MLVSSTLRRYNIILSQGRAGEVKRKGEMQKISWAVRSSLIAFHGSALRSLAPRGAAPPSPIIIPPAAQLRQQPSGSKLKQSSLLIGPGKMSFVPSAQSVAAWPIQQSPALRQALAAAASRSSMPLPGRQRCLSSRGQQQQQKQQRMQALRVRHPVWAGQRALAPLDHSVRGLCVSGALRAESGSSLGLLCPITNCYDCVVWTSSTSPIQVPKPLYCFFF